MCERVCACEHVCVCERVSVCVWERVCVWREAEGEADLLQGETYCAVSAGPRLAG